MAILAINLTILLLASPLASLAEEPRTLTRLIDPIEVSGIDVSNILGMEISNLRAIASRNGKLTSIPYQIDQKGSDNDWVWSVTYKTTTIDNWDDDSFEQEDSLENLTYDDQDPPGKSIFDDNDVIVFLAKDAGDRDRERIKRLGAERLTELEIIDPVNQSKGWVYLVYFKSNVPALSDIRYVQYEPERFLVTGPEHEFLYSPKHSMVLDDFRLDGASVFVQNRIRGEVEAGIGPVKLNFDFNEKTIEGYDAGYINGPVRVIKRSVEQVRLGSGIVSPFVNCDHYHYPWHAEIPILISKRFPVQQVSILATSIFKKSKFTSMEADGVDKPILLSKRASHGNLLVDYTKAEWIELSGEEISIINSVKIPEDHKGHLDISPYVIDDNSILDNYDAEPALGVEAGFSIKTTDATPGGDHVIHSVFLFTTDTNRDDYLINAIKLLQSKLIHNAVLIE